jgi:RNA polymerase sigma-70 factor (ECF subfamily)
MAAADQSVRALIELARNPAAAQADRHVAFGTLVCRFQDFVFAYVYARLRDPALAEDATQDTFVSAWQNLDQLRAPAAFSVWLRRLALTQCHRRLRGKRVMLVPEESARDVAAATNGAAADDDNDAAGVLRHALSSLGPADRLVLVLFYGSERSHAEIASWLGVPVTTVARRLAHARRRLRKKTLDAVSGALHAQHAGRSTTLVHDLAARLRPLVGTDAADLLDLPGGVSDSRVPMVSATAPALAFIVEDPATDTPIAYAAAVPTPFAPIYELQFAIGRDGLNRHAGDVLLTEVLAELAARHVVTLQYRVSARHAAIIRFLLARGFQIAERRQDWRLSPAEAAVPKRASTSQVRVESRSVDAVLADRELFDSALQLIEEVVREDQSKRYLLPVHPDTLKRSLQQQTEAIVATREGALQGLLLASRDPTAPGALRINLLACRSPRRRSLSTALVRELCSTHRVPVRVVAAPTPDLAWCLEHCGFVTVAAQLVLERLLQETVQVPSDRLNEYVGRYVTPAMPDAPIVIERHGDSLVSKARDMRDILLAASETEFFTRHHHGRGRFERDRSGRVSRLVFTEGPREFVAERVE